MHNVVTLHVQNEVVTKDAYMANINYSTSIQKPTSSGAEVPPLLGTKYKTAPGVDADKTKSFNSTIQLKITQ